MELPIANGTKNRRENAEYTAEDSTRTVAMLM
jgi:hypothetical protein